MSKTEKNLKEAFAGESQANRNISPSRRRPNRRVQTGGKAVPGRR